MKSPKGMGIRYCVFRKYATAFMCLESNMVFMSGAVSFPYGGTIFGISGRTTLQTFVLTLFRIAEHANFFESVKLVEQVL